MGKSGSNSLDKGRFTDSGVFDESRAKVEIDWGGHLEANNNFSENIKTPDRVLLESENSEIESSVEKPIEGSREVLFLLQLLARLKDHLNLKIEPITVQNINKFRLDSGSQRFQAANGVLAGIQPNCIKKGKVGVFVNLNDRMIHLFDLGQGCTIGGGECGWLDNWQIPSDLIYLKVSDDTYVSPEIPIAHSVREAHMLPFHNLISDLAQVGCNSVAHYLSSNMRILGDFGSNNIKYGVPVEKLKAAVTNDLNNSNKKKFYQALQIAIRLSIENISPYRKGADLYTGNDIDFHAQFNNEIFLPIISQDIRRLKMQMSDSQFQDIYSDTENYYRENFVTSKPQNHAGFKSIVKEGLALMPKEDPQILINRLLDVPEDAIYSQSKAGEYLKISNEGRLVLKFLYLARQYATPDVMQDYLSAHNIRDIDQLLSSLQSSGLIETYYDQTFMTPSSLQYIKSEITDEDRCEFCKFLIDYFINQEIWFFVIELLEKLDQLDPSAVRLYIKKAESFLRDLIVIPHPIIPNDYQYRGLKILAKIYAGIPEKYHQVELAMITNAHLRGNFELTADLIRQYFNKEAVHPKSIEEKNTQMEMIMIYIETLVKLDDWKGVQTFFDQYGDFFPTKIEQSGLAGIWSRLSGNFSKKSIELSSEKQFWQANVKVRSDLVLDPHGDFEKRAMQAARQLKIKFDTFCSDEEVSPHTRLKFIIDLQRLFLFGANSLEGDEKIAAYNEAINLLKDEDLTAFEGISPVLQAPMWGNASIAYKKVGLYRDSLKYLEKATIDTRGSCRFLADSSQILEDEIFEPFKQAFESNDWEAAEKYFNSLIQTLQFLAIEGGYIPHSSRRKIIDLLDEMNSISVKEIDIDYMNRLYLTILELGYRMNERALFFAEQIGLPKERVMSRLNMFDSLWNMNRKFFKEHEDDEGNLPEHMEEFRIDDDLVQMADHWLQTSSIFNEHFLSIFFNMGNMSYVFAKYFTEAVVDLIDWLDLALLDENKGSKDYNTLHSRLMEVKRNLVNYWPLIQKHESMICKIIEGPLPDEIDQSMISLYESELNDYDNAHAFVDLDV